MVGNQKDSKSFCGAFGLLINEAKSTFHYTGLSLADLDPFKSFFPFSYTDLSLGFRYLGYFLKPDLLQSY
jgi:hypothetical protein